MREFSKRLKELRTEKRMTLRELSDATGLSKTSLSRWENGFADIKSDELVKLSRYFKVSTDYLLGETDY